MARLWSFLSAEQISIVCTLQAWHLFKQFVAQLAAWCPHYYFIMFLLNVEHDVGLRPFFRLPESVRDTLGSKKSDQIVAAIDELYLESGSTSQMVMISDFRGERREDIVPARFWRGRSAFESPEAFQLSYTASTSWVWDLQSDPRIWNLKIGVIFFCLFAYFVCCSRSFPFLS